MDSHVAMQAGQRLYRCPVGGFWYQQLQWFMAKMNKYRIIICAVYGGIKSSAEEQESKTLDALNKFYGKSCTRIEGQYHVLKHDIDEFRFSSLRHALSYAQTANCVVSADFGKALTPAQVEKLKNGQWIPA